MIPPALVPEPIVKLDIIEDVVSSFYVHLEVEDRPGVLAQVAQILGMQDISVKSVVQKGHGRAGPPRDGGPPDEGVELRRRPPAHVAARLPAFAAAGDPGDRGGVPLIPGVIERYRDRLPFGPQDPVVTLHEGSTPLVPATRISERAGREVLLKLEGANPTGSFKDRGMTCAVSAAVREGARAVICASTGNTAASAAAYAARAGLTGAVIVPEGKIATGKLAQALMHGARVVSFRGSFDRALELVRELADRHPVALVNSSTRFGWRARRPAPSRSSTRSERSTRCASRSGTPAT
jgi:hypothetical protein